MPTIGDIHQDHHTIAAEGLRAFKRTTILGYEIPWNQFSFAKQAYVVLEERHLDAKVRGARVLPRRSSTATTRTRSTSATSRARTASRSAGPSPSASRSCGGSCDGACVRCASC